MGAFLILPALRRAASLALFGCAAYALVFPCGCATRRDADVSALRRALGYEALDEGAGPVEGPEKPDSGLPPLAIPAADNGAGSRRDDGRADVTIQPGCLVQVSIKEDPGLDGSYPVNEIGAVELGYIGAVILLNCSETEAEALVRKVLLRREFRSATVDVRIVRASYDSISVKGDVNRSGLIRIGSGGTITLNDALLRAGGIRGSAKETMVKVVRGGLTNAVADSLPGEEYSLVGEEEKPQVPDVALRNNDVVQVFSWRGKAMPEGGWKEILVLGEVRQQGPHRFTPNDKCTIMHLVLKMGGLPQFADRSRIKVFRRDEEGNEKEIVVDAREVLKSGKPEDDFPLLDGDRVIVPERKLILF